MLLFDGPVADPDSMETLGARLGSVLRRGDLLVLTGALGAGKTTMTHGIGRAMRVRGQVASPTFVLARTHPSLEAGGVPLVHVDAYRLGGPAELDDLDLDYEGSVVVVEWGDGLLDGVADSWLDVRIERRTGAAEAAGDPAETEEPEDAPLDEPRRVTIETHGPRWTGVELPA